MKKRYAIFVLITILHGFAYTQDISDFEDLDKVTEKGFFKNYVSGLFKGFGDFGEPFVMNGGLGLNMRSYSAFGADARQDPFFYSLNANANIRIYKLNLPFSLMVSAKNTESAYPNIKELIRAFRNNVENKIENQKNRFVRFGTSPRFKWIKLHFGHRSMNFSQFTLANLNFLGAGMELTPGNLRIAAMYGQLAKAEPIDLSLTTPNIPVFERKGWGMKVGYGTNEEYLDLSVFKAQDDLNSIEIPDESPNPVSPEENLVIGINAQKTFFDNFNLKVEYASSAISPNAADANASNKFPHPGFLFDAKQTTEYKNALESSLDFQAKIFTVGMAYKRIDPNYRSLGAYYFNNDIEDITGNLSFGLLENAVNVNLSGGVQTNNLDNSQASTLTRFIGTANIGYTLNSFNLTLNYTNNSSDIAYLLDPELDSLNVIIVTQDAGLNASYSFQDASSNQHVLTGTLNAQMVTDEVVDPMSSAASQMLVGNLVYNYSLSESKWKFSLKANYNQNELAQMIMRRYGGGLGVTKGFLEGKINTGLDLNYFLMTNQNTDDQTNLNGQFRLSYKISDSQSLNMNWNLLSTKKGSGSSASSFSELTGTLGYQFNFGTKPKTKEEREARKEEKRQKKEESSLDDDG